MKHEIGELLRITKLYAISREKLLEQLTLELKLFEIVKSINSCDDYDIEVDVQEDQGMKSNENIVKHTGGIIGEEEYKNKDENNHLNENGNQNESQNQDDGIEDKKDNIKDV